LEEYLFEGGLSKSFIPSALLRDNGTITKRIS